MIIIDCKQGEDEWFAEKAGVPSAGSFKKIVDSTGKPSKSRVDYLDQLADEAIRGSVERGYQSGPMSVGIEREAEARELYEDIHGVEVKQVGFIYPDEQKKYGCSPDGLIGGEIAGHARYWGHGLEIKNPLGKTHVKYLRENKLPTGVGYFQQIQGSLLITGFDVWDFMSYVPGHKPFILQVERDEQFIAKLRAELERFCFELAGMIKRLK